MCCILNENRKETMLHRNTSYKKHLSKKDEVFQKELSDNLKRLKVPGRISKEEAWKNFLNNIENNKIRNLSKPNYLKKYLSIAASILLIIASYWIFTITKTEEYTCERAETKTILLPDNSKIILNAESMIKFYPGRWSLKRDIYLDGEAFFEVEKGKKFSVITRNGEINVLGTKFNVLSRKNDLKVYCASGKVMVKRNKDVILSKGQKIESVNNNEISEITIADTIKSASWLKGEFWFDKSPLANVFKEVERQFNVDIIYQEKDQRFYTGYFNNDDLNEALVNVCEPMSLSFKIMDDKIYIGL